MKGPHEVLGTGKINGGLSPERSIHHREQTRGDGNKRNATMPRRGQEAGQVSGDAAAERDDNRVPPRTPLHEPVLEQRFGVARFGTLSGWKREEYGLNALGGKPPDELLAVEPSHAGVRNDDLQAARKGACEMGRGVLERPRGHDDGGRPCGSRPRLDAEANRSLADWDQFGGVFELEPKRSRSAR